jgi:hypothetical protein
MVRQKFLDRLLDQDLHGYAAQDGGQLELPVFCLGNTRADLGFGLAASDGDSGIRRNRAGFHTRSRAGFLGGRHGRLPRLFVN